MKTKILYTLFFVTLLAACSKDKYETRPQLKFKEINSKTLRQGDVVTITLEVTDAEGDIQDSMFVEKITRNCVTNNVVRDKYRMPEFTGTKNLKADIEVSYIYNVLNAGRPAIVRSNCTSQNDSTRMRFWIKDKGGNISDTIVTDEFVLLR